jgi:hypothetical protein
MAVNQPREQRMTLGWNDRPPVDAGCVKLGCNFRDNPILHQNVHAWLRLLAHSID